MYDNLKAAWIILCIDNIPPQVRPPESVFESRVISQLLELFSQRELVEADFILGTFREENDINDIDSVFWNVCNGEYVAFTDEKIGLLTNSVLNELFELL